MIRSLALVLLATTSISAFVVVTPPVQQSRASRTLQPTTKLQATTTSNNNISSSSSSRREFLTSGIAAALATTLLPFSAAYADDSFTTSNGVTVSKQKLGNGPKPDVGELAAIRFKAFCGDVKIDDIFDTQEPYYTRVGSGGMIKGVEEVLPMMQVGDRWTLTIPGPLAFGKEGRKASAGKPRIPSDATIVFDVEMVGVPGKEPELIELIGDV